MLFSAFLGVNNVSMSLYALDQCCFFWFACKGAPASRRPRSCRPKRPSRAAALFTTPTAPTDLPPISVPPAMLVRQAARQGRQARGPRCSPTAVSVLDLAPYTGPGGRHFGANTCHSSQQLLCTLSDAMRPAPTVWTKPCIMVTITLPYRHARDQRIRR